MVQKSKLDAKDWAGLKTANNIHTLSSMLDKGIAPDSKEGVKMMLAAKIAQGGSLSFTDGKEFACNPERLQGAVAGEAIAGLGGRVQLRRAALRSELLLVGAAELVFAPLLAAPSNDAAAVRTMPDVEAS